METVISSLDKLSNVLGVGGAFNRWSNSGETEFQLQNVGGVEFRLRRNYRDLRLIGQGAQGVVCACYDSIRGHKVAVKKVSKPFRNAIDAKRVLKEIRVLKQTNHKNIIRLVEIYSPCNRNEAISTTDIYIVTELMESTLADIISISLDHNRMSYLLYQLLCGLHYLHRCGIVHRDLKPSNIAVNSDCTLRILDFGLSRSPDNSFMMTPYVMTRYYRAPEVILRGLYDFPADVWSVGCIVAEMCRHQILFRGEDYLDQWRIIEETLGSPSGQFLDQLSQPVKTYLERRPFQAGLPFEIVIRDSDFMPDVENTDLTVRLYENDHSYVGAFSTVVISLTHPYVNVWFDEAEVYGSCFAFSDQDIEESLRRGNLNDLLKDECFA